MTKIRVCVANGVIQKKGLTHPISTIEREELIDPWSNSSETKPVRYQQTLIMLHSETTMVERQVYPCIDHIWQLTY